MQMSLASTSLNENVAAKLILHQDCARPSMIRDNLLALRSNFFLKTGRKPARIMMNGCHQHQYRILGAICPRVAHAMCNEYQMIRNFLL